MIDDERRAELQETMLETIAQRFTEAMDEIEQAGGIASEIIIAGVERAIERRRTARRAN